jgi:signal transduction histidine kinase
VRRFAVASRGEFAAAAVNLQGETSAVEIALRADAPKGHRRYGQFVNRSRIALRWRSIRGRVDWVVAVVLACVGVVDVIHTRFADPLWAGVVVTLFVFLPLGVRRRFPLAVLVTVAVASLLLELALGDPANAKQYGFEVFLAWLIVSYSTAAHTQGRRHLVALAVALATAAIWLTWSFAAGASNENTVPSVFLSAVAWLGGRAMRRREAQVEALGARAERLEREREQRVQALVAEERARIARELHDVVAHSVSVMVVQAQAGPRLLADPEQIAATFGSIEASGREALVELRRLLGILRTGDAQLAIGPQPGLGSLEGLVEQVNEAGLPVELRIEGEGLTLPPGVDLSAYRIVQEALTNTLKHAGRAHAHVVVRYSAFAVELEVVDDGLGAPATNNGSGHGLIGMRERTALYGGRLEAGPRAGGGYAVRARLPLGGTP